MNTCEREHHSTLRNLGDAVISSRIHEGIVYMNPVAENITGWLYSEAQGRSLTDVLNIINQRTGNTLESLVSRVVHDGAVICLEGPSVLIARDLQEIPVDGSIAPLRDERGSVVGITVLFFRDFDNVIMNAERLRRYSEHLEYLVDQRTAELKRMNKQLKQEIVDREYMEDALRQSSEKFRNLVSNLPCVIYQRAWDEFWTMFFISEDVEHLTGYWAAEFVKDLSVSYVHIIHEGDQQRVQKALQEGIEQRRPFSIEYRINHRNGSIRWIGEKGQGVYDDRGNLLWLDGTLSDITEFKRAEAELHEYREHLETLVEERTGELMRVNKLLQQDIEERKRIEKRQNLAVQVLELLNRSGRDVDVIRDIIYLIKHCTGLSAVGIRLRAGEDFPYYETNGFSESFVATEQYLCSRDDRGEIQRDSAGNPFLECRCGEVISGRTDHNLSTFTEYGSFWTNSSTDLITSNEEAGHKNRFRRYCNKEGYESVALIPLRSDDEIIGLLQLNDFRKDMFTEETIRFFEGLGSSIGIALMRKRTEEALHESEATLRSIFRVAPVGIGLAVTYMLRWTNTRLQEMLGYASDELRGTSMRILFPTDEDYAFAVREQVDQIERFGTGTVETRWIRKDGVIIDVLLGSTPLEPDDLSLGITFTALDITDRKRAEDRIRKSLKEKDVMLKEIHHRVKNNMQVISSLISLQARRIKDDRYRRLFEESKNRILSMALVHEKLYHSENMASIDFTAYIDDLIHKLLQSYGHSPNNVRFKTDIQDVRLGVDVAIPCALIINELVSNALKYAFPGGMKGEIEIIFTDDAAGVCTLVVGDSGIGFPDDVDYKDTESLGMKLVNALTNQLKGSLELDRNGGTKFTLQFNLGDQQI